MSFFQDLLDKSKNLIRISPKITSIVGIDIGSASLKVVQVSRAHGKIQLETYGQLDLASYTHEALGKPVTMTPETVATAIKDILREANVTTPNACMAIQSQAVLIFLIELPRVSESEIASIIPNEARKYIPVPLTEVSLDWYVVPDKTPSQAEDPQAKIEVVVVAVRNESLAQYRDIAEKSGIQTVASEIEIFSTIRSVFHREIAPTLIVDFGASTTKIAVVEYGVVRTYHVANRGSAFITESVARAMNIEFDRAEEMKKVTGMSNLPEHTKLKDALTAQSQYIINEIQTVALQYERQSHKAITKIILAGGGSKMPGFLEQVAQVFGIETVYGDPFDKAESPEFMQPVLKQAGPEFTIAMGLALKEFI